MDIICVNDSFSPDMLEYMAYYGITAPVKDKIYTVRDVVNYPTTEAGLLLNEIVNPSTPRTSLLTRIKGESEQTWKISRFTTLMGKPITKEEIKQLITI